MNTCDLQTTLNALFTLPERAPSVLLLGAPGVGKTAIVAQCAAKACLSLATIALPTCEAVDLRGLPHIDTLGRTQWASPLPREGKGVLLLDELSSAAPDVQVAAHHIVWAERGSDMSTSYHVVLTGNRASDKTLFRATSGPLRNRLIILNIEPELEQWIAWGQTYGIAPEVIGFLRWRPVLLAAKEIPKDGAFPSPRAWERVSQILSLSVSQSIERELLSGTIGDGPATEFAAYLHSARELDTIEKIKSNPTKARVPSEPSTLYALTSLLAHYTRGSKRGIMAYVKRLPAEFALLYVRDIKEAYDIGSDKEIRNWIAEHPRLFSLEA